ncbi:MAG TPA: regulatory protein RecX [Rudaea sp.]
MSPRKPDRDPPNAYDKALGLLARREHSARELKSKLARRGVDADESAQALEKLKEKGYQDDARFGEMLVRTRIEGGYGPRWIVAELKTHGISEADARALIEAAEPDWRERVREQLRRRYGTKPPANLAERAKRAAFLLRRGFDAAIVRGATGGIDASDDSD